MRLNGRGHGIEPGNHSAWKTWLLYSQFLSSYGLLATESQPKISQYGGDLVPTLVDLSHTIRPDMPRFQGIESPHIRAVWAHADAAERGYVDTSCELTEVRFVTSIGTYLDAPYHFDPKGADISQLVLSQLVLPGLVVDLRDQAEPDAPLPVGVLDGLDVTDRALLLCTGWSQYWGDERYHRPPFVSRPMAEHLRDLRPRLVGIDTLVIDSSKDPTRPTHTLLLRSGILIVENLDGLSILVGESFTFLAVPVKVAGAAAFPVRAFAILDD
jgi:arylformamidase